MFKMFSCGSNSGMEMSAPPVSGIVNNALFQATHQGQMLHQITHILQFCLADSLLYYSIDFVVNWTEVRAVRRPQIWKFIGVTTISYWIIAFSEWRQQMMHRLLG